MRLNPSQLSAHLAKGLAPIYVVAGDEPLLVQESLDAIRAAARKAGFSERQVLDADRYFNWQEVADSSASLSLFASKRIVEVRLPGAPGDEGSKVLQHLARTANPDTLVILACAEVDKKGRASAWYTALEEAGASVYCAAVRLEEFPQWLEGRCRAAGVQLAPDALKLLAERTEGNLLAAEQDIAKLKLLFPGQAIGVELLAQSVADSARFEAFDLIDRVLDGDAEGSVRTLARLREEGAAPLEVLGALGWCLRKLAGAAQAYARTRDAYSACQQAGVFGPQAARYQRAVPRIRPAEALSWLRRAAQIDYKAKSGQEAAAWEELLTLILAASGSPAKRAA
ncbi:MAG TPA: DNA polymerase III subunit delta [Solimonas sp.]|nr:DNA polymerase III subunit delta [Solimonas sp.]